MWHGGQAGVPAVLPVEQGTYCSSLGLHSNTFLWNESFPCYRMPLVFPTQKSGYAASLQTLVRHFTKLQSAANLIEYGPSQESFTLYAWMGELALNRPYQTQLPEGMDVRTKNMNRGVAVIS